MTWQMAARAAAALALALAGITAAPAAAPAAAAPAAAPAKVEAFRVLLTGMETLPAPEAPPVTPRVLKEKDLVFVLPVAMEAQARLAADVKVPLGGYDWPVRQAEDLTLAASWSGGDLAGLAKDAVVYCAPPFSKKGGIEATLLTLGLANIASRFSTWLQLCLVDEDRDSRFEKAFMIGTKKAPDRITVPIEPVAYTASAHVPIPDSRFEVMVFDGGPMIAPNFELHVFLRGTKVDIGGIVFPANLAPPEVMKDKAARKAWEKDRPSQLSWTFPVKAAELPRAYVVGDAAFRVTALDPVGKTMTVALDRASAGFPFAVTYRPQTIYIYIP